ncbi:MAG: cell wall hydrolase [Pontiellaceae bacterium]|jgi:spore germination cell wall hydrolase CwlJ-like protein|nr:cell wall hydrolase [Pontiellaceae bacterium]
MKRNLWVLTILFGLVILRTPAEELLDSDTRQIVAACMVLEAGGEGIQGMQAVLNVILNRADGCLDKMRQQTVKYAAFSCMSSIWKCENPDFAPLFERAKNQTKVYKQALQLITQMEEGTLVDNTGGATHFHASSIRPYWADSLRYLTTIGNHIFYVEHNRKTASR